MLPPAAPSWLSWLKPRLVVPLTVRPPVNGLPLVFSKVVLVVPVGRPETTRPPLPVICEVPLNTCDQEALRYPVLDPKSRLAPFQTWASQFTSDPLNTRMVPFWKVIVEESVVRALSTRVLPPRS